MSGNFHAVASSTGNPGSYRGGITEWPTPQWLVDQLAAEFGPFDVDVAATAANAKAPRFFTVVDNGLAQPWHGVIWCNPPYGKTATPAWLAKARQEVNLGHATRVVCLVPARVGTIWWRECEVDQQVFVRVIGRIRWQVDHRGEAPFDSAVIVFGRLPGRHGRYPSTCANPACPRPYRRFWPARSDARWCSDRCRMAAVRDKSRKANADQSAKEMGDMKDQRSIEHLTVDGTWAPGPDPRIEHLTEDGTWAPGPDPRIEHLTGDGTWEPGPDPRTPPVAGRPAQPGSRTTSRTP